MVHKAAKEIWFIRLRRNIRRLLRNMVYKAAKLYEKTAREYGKVT